MNRTPPLALLLLLATAASGQAPETRPIYDGMDAEVALAGIVAAPRLVRSVRTLCDARGPLPFEWIEGCLSASGLPTSRTPASSTSVSQVLTSSCSISIEGRRHPLESAWPLCGSAGQPGAGGPLRPMDAEDLDGACAWIPRRSGSAPLSRELLRRLAARGAVAALVGYLDEEEEPEPFAGAPLWALSGQEALPAGFCVVSLGPADTGIVTRALASGREVIAALSATVIRSEGSSHGVLSRIPGQGGGPLVLLTACWTPDCGGPGATARASGVAALLEVARILRVSLRAGEIPPLPFDLLLAIWCDESGLAEWLAAHPEAVADLALCIRLERLGPGRPEGALFLDAFGSSPGEPLVGRCRSALEGYAGRRGFWPRLEVLDDRTPPEVIPWRRRPLPPAPCLSLSTAPADPPWARGVAAARETAPTPGFGPQVLTGWDHPDHLEPKALAFGLEAGTRAALVLIARLAREGLD
jgi:hypothetical protein